MNIDKRLQDFRKEVEKLKEIDGAEEYAKQLAHLFLSNGLSLQTILLMAIDFGQQHPQWIPVEERLPEETEVVLGVREGGTDVEMYKFMGFNESTNTFDWEWHPYYRAVVDDVTHWMPIVPPRKEE